MTSSADWACATEHSQSNGTIAIRMTVCICSANGSVGAARSSVVALREHEGGRATHQRLDQHQFLVGMIDERSAPDVLPGLLSGQDVERPVVLLGRHGLLARRVGRGGDLRQPITSAEIGLLRISLHVDTRSTNADGGVSRCHADRVTARENREDLPREQLKAGQHHGVGFLRLHRYAAFATLDEGALADDVDGLAVRPGLDRRARTDARLDGSRCSIDLYLTVYPVN